MWLLRWTLLLGVIWSAEAGMMGDQCDWTGSGLSSTAERGVTPVYLRCREGIISWVYPRGALRLLFRPPLPADERDFRVCVRIMRRPDPPDLFHDLRQNDTAFRILTLKVSNPMTKCWATPYKWERRYNKGCGESLDVDGARLFLVAYFGGGLYPAVDEKRLMDDDEGFANLQEVASRFPARLFVEGAHKLVPLYAPNDGDPRELRCFRSRRSRAALYVEAEPEEGTLRKMAVFRYEAISLVKRHYDPSTADCRPCTESELELAFCTSDLVSRGVIIGSEAREDLETTQLTLRLTKLIRATGGEEQKEKPDLTDQDGYYRYEVDNTLERTTHRNHRRRKPRCLHAHVHVSSVCGAAAGAGEFLVMARRRLGRYSLVCAPRIHDWTELVKRRNEEGTAHCLLQH